MGLATADGLLAGGYTLATLATAGAHSMANPSTPKSAGEGEAFRPFVDDAEKMREFTWPAIVSGTLLGIVFGTSSLYLVLKVGLTVSASIPVAVLSVTLFRALSAFGVRRTTILENNIVQTAGSAGESIAFGVGVSMPALLMLGYDISLERVMVVSVLGGLLGILMMIPLRRAFIVRLHGKAGEPGKLLYPEGTACAEVLKSGERGGAAGGLVVLGFAIAAVHKIATEGLHLLSATVSQPLAFFNRGAVLASDMASEMLGVGYIIGTRTSSVMFAGALLGYLTIAPLLYVSEGPSLEKTVLAAVQKEKPEVTSVSPAQIVNHIRQTYLLYIGAGCVTAAGIISMFRTLPLIVRSAGAGLKNLRGSGAAKGADRRTDRDMPLSLVLIGSAALVILLAIWLMQEMSPQGAVLGALLVVCFGFLFVTVSSRLTGEIGSSSNPISGMTVATLALTCAIFLALGMTSPLDKVLALSIGAVVCIAASNGGTTSQDLKTGYLVGATPKLQQWAILIGAVSSALVIGGTLLLFNAAGTIYSEKNLPTANLSAQLRAMSKETYKGKEYSVWWVTEDLADGTKPGKYLVDEQGVVRFLVDPAIVGRLEEKDDGSKATFKFTAPKTQVMAIIINGVLGGTLNTGLMLAGAMIAVTLELCGVSSLAFAVGMYIPPNISAPIFLGGLVRWAVDKFSARGNGKEDEATRVARTESSPGVLLASGFIAGGSLAGVALAFVEFSEPLKEKMNLAGHDGAIVESPLVVLAVFSVLVVGLLTASKLFRSGQPAPKDSS
jgi:putative OPT family oligopeptide transporter